MHTKEQRERVKSMAKLPIVPLNQHVRLLKAELQAIEDALPPVPDKKKAPIQTPTPRMIWYGVPFE